jgi:hypothetical protein
MKNDKVIKIVGIFATVTGMAATLVSSWVSEKKLDSTITEKVNEALANKKD